MLVMNAGGTGLRMGTSCPDWENARAAAIVNFESPLFIYVGFILLTLGFLLQYLAVPDPSTIDKLRTELKALKQKQKRK